MTCPDELREAALWVLGEAEPGIEYTLAERLWMGVRRALWQLAVALALLAAADKLGLV
jgi:hypothetical protein